MSTSTRFRCPIFVSAIGSICCAVVLTSPCPAQQAGDLPPESQLPDRGENNRADSDDLPSEAEIPDDDDAVQIPPDLPGEDAIPGAATAADVDQGSAPLSEQVQPILRLDFDGHTGFVRILDIADGGRTLVTAGDDKDLHVWRRTDIGKTGWLHRRTIRWPIWRGPRGRIYACAMHGDLVAFAGYGAYGDVGEIRVADAASGQLAFDPLIDKHRQVLASLAWAPQEKDSDELRLVSIDMEGHTTLWTRDPATRLWSAKVLVENDTQQFGAEAAKSLFYYRRFVPIAFLGRHQVAMPQYAGFKNNTAFWHIRLIDLRTGEKKTLSDLDHLTYVLDFTSTPDGRVFASCDLSGAVAVWAFQNGVAGKAKIIRPKTLPLSLDMDPSGKRLLIGSRAQGEPEVAQLSLWDLTADTPTLLSAKTIPVSAVDVALDADHQEVIVTQSNNIQIHPLDEDGKFVAETRTLAIPAAPVLKVAFSKEDEYKIAIGTRRDERGKVVLDGVFDLSASKLLGRGPIDPDDYLPQQRTATRWQFGGPEMIDGGPRYKLYEGELARGVLPLRQQLHGYPYTACTLPKPSTGSQEAGEKPETGAVVIGTTLQNDIFAYAADSSDPPRLLRRFRGHSGSVLSLSTSADGKYLVSGAEDAIVNVWNLQDLFTASESVNRWGVEFEVDGDQLIAAEVREDGPLYFMGVRGGDRLISIRWADATGKAEAESDAQQMFDQMMTLPFDALVTFQFTRLGRARPGFQSYAAWRPLASLFVDQTREWAFWTPAGYYDASFNGHQRFGWQVNKGRQLPPDFFRAAQFRKILERPGIMRQLLASGSLPAAMRQSVGKIGPPPGDEAIVNQYLNKPRIELIQPRAGATIEGDSLTVQAKITVPLGATLAEPRAFVSGVPATNRRIIASDDAEGSFTYEWQFRLPSDRDLQLEVLAATEAEAVDRVLVDLVHPPGNRPRPKPRLHVLAIGVGDYPDPQIQSLDFAADAARNVTKLFQTKSAAIYDTTADQLVDEDATRSLWRVFAQQAAAQLSETVSPDDLVIMYLCGHGIRDRLTDQWYFVTADTRYSDLMNDEYSHCIAFSDLAALAKLPCRKLAILDSCHSGAVQPVMQRDDLKSALRFLQDDVVLAITASEGDEEAAEQREARMGRFTSKLVQALEGAANQDGDDVVTLNEVIAYVSQAVSEESEQEGMPQHPTASPDYLLRTLQLPLTAASPP